MLKKAAAAGKKFLDIKVSGSDIRLCCSDIVYAEHFAHIINIHTVAGKTLATRQSFKVFTESLKEDPRFFICGRGVIVNLEQAEDFEADAFLYEGWQPRLCLSESSEKCPSGVYGIFAAKGAHRMKDVLRPILELTVILPGLLLSYFPVKSYLKKSPGGLAAWVLPLLAGFLYRRRTHLL